ncbi:hypothetical protein D7S89_06185 [Trinickia fusca]|uniref:CHAT domain-containing protein n=2 Tax=Trinickia fusca TaxID=2419777 RepID=A0A494XIW2_9BURK|nr:hypothetical protein D7S89_06185 [Trinickia fusca]
MHAPFTFTKIVIIQSLEPDERQTGAILRDYLAGLNSQRDQPVPIEFVLCESVVHFREIILRLVDECKSGEIPLLHVECHGDENDGLQFENGSELAWRDAAELLRQLNIACEYNLFASFAACFGAYFLGAIAAYSTSPCYAMLAPTGPVYPDEIETGFKQFYADLFQTWDAGISVRRLQRRRLVNGRWFAETAESWFERVVIDYVRVHCTHKALKKRIRKIYREALAAGKRQSIGYLKRMAIRRNKRTYLGDYFMEFFAIAQIPDNRGRFLALFNRMKRRLEDIWLQPEYRR